VINKPDGSHDENTALPPQLATDLPKETTGFSAITNFYLDDSRIAVPEAGGPSRTFLAGGEADPYHMVFVDPQYFEIFRYQWLAGNSATALNAPFSVVLSESAARRYFLQGSPVEWMGRTLIYHDSINVSVKGIVKDYPKNSDLSTFTDWLSFTTLTQSGLGRGMMLGYNGISSEAGAFVKLSPGSSAEQVSRQFAAIGEKHMHSPWALRPALHCNPRRYPFQRKFA